MSSRLTRAAYTDLINEDIEWLLRMPRSLERDHVLMVLKEAVRYEYGPERKEY